MQDFYAQLIGAPPANEAQLRATAEALRNKQAGGLLAQLSGDRVLSPVGSGLQQQVFGEHQGLQKARLAEEQRKMMEQMYRDQLAETSRHNRATEGLQSEANMLRMLKGLGAGGLSLTPGQEAVDKKYAEDYIKFKSGGYAEAQRGLAEINKVAEMLGNSDSLTGGAIGLVPKFARDVLFPSSSEAQELAERPIQATLREVLGAQFTKEEGENLLARTYNPRLPEHVNRERIVRLAKALDIGLKQKLAMAQHFEKYGTISQFPSLEFNWSDFDPDVLEAAEKAGKLTPEAFGGGFGGGGIPPGMTPIQHSGKTYYTDGQNFYEAD